jgi:hypothetical protein
MQETEQVQQSLDSVPLLQDDDLLLAIPMTVSPLCGLVSRIRSYLQPLLAPPRSISSSHLYLFSLLSRLHPHSHSHENS